MTVLEETANDIISAIDSWRSKLLLIDLETARHKPAPERWSIAEVIGHLVDSACNNHQRFVRAQSCDALEFPKYDQNEWVSRAGYQSCDWQSLVELWFHYNRQLAELIRHIPEQHLATPCTITPYETCTLEFLVSDYLSHLNHHLAKIDDRL